MRILTLLAILFVDLARASDSNFLFKEKDGKANILYIARCNQFESARCSLFSISISSNCKIFMQKLLSEAKAIQSGSSWTVTSTAGLCNYTNTYTFSKSGMVQVKTAPTEKAGDHCETFEPRTYKAEFVDSALFEKVSAYGCKTVDVDFFGI